MELWDQASLQHGGGTFLYLIRWSPWPLERWFLDEPVTFSIVAGGALMLAGVAIAQFGPTVFVRR